MQIEEGKYYRDVQGVRRGPAVRTDDGRWQWDLGDISGYYNDDGTCPYIPTEDLVGEWTSEVPQVRSPDQIISEIEELMIELRSVTL